MGRGSGKASHGKGAQNEEEDGGGGAENVGGGSNVGAAEMAYRRALVREPNNVETLFGYAQYLQVIPKAHDARGFYLHRVQDDLNSITCRMTSTPARVG